MILFRLAACSHQDAHEAATSVMQPVKFRVPMDVEDFSDLSVVHLRVAACRRRKHVG
jgi:hypothetical protein